MDDVNKKKQLPPEETKDSDLKKKVSETKKENNQKENKDAPDKEEVKH